MAYCRWSTFLPRPDCRMEELRLAREMPRLPLDMSDGEGAYSAWQADLDAFLAKEGKVLCDFYVYWLAGCGGVRADRLLLVNWRSADGGLARETLTEADAEAALESRAWSRFGLRERRADADWGLQIGALEEALRAWIADLDDEYGRKEVA